jgi:hypothetical protein
LPVVVLVASAIFIAVLIFSATPLDLLRASLRRHRLVVLTALAGVLATGAFWSRGNWTEPGTVGSIGACSSLLVCLLGAYALRQPGRGAIDPQEGRGSTRVLHRGRWAGGCGRAATGSTTRPRCKTDVSVR